MNWMHWVSVLKLLIVMCIGLIFIVGNRMFSICMPWLMTYCVLMINVDSSMFIMRFLMKDFMILLVSSFCLVCHNPAVDKISHSWLVNSIVIQINIYWILSDNCVLWLVNWISFMIGIIWIMVLFLEAVVLIVFSMFLMVSRNIDMCVGWFMVGMMGSLIHWLMMS